MSTALYVSSILSLALASFAATDDEALQRALQRADNNRTAIEAAIAGVEAAHRDALQFLVTHMPKRDLLSFDTARLIDECKLAHEAWDGAPWREAITADLFREWILPYANVSEARDPWRATLRPICLPLIVDCATPLAAAQRLNERLFEVVNVRYSTARQRADQSPKESMQSGLASCTGLSILLVDACRSVGIPARLVGTPNWKDKRGNHTWVEVWDGTWHFTGAAEPDARGFDHAWFEGDAAKAVPGRAHGIFAVRWQRTGTEFPLAWSRGDEAVAAEEVTSRYAKPPEASLTQRTELFVKVVDASGRRVQAEVVLTPTPTNHSDVQRGTSRDESVDTNDLLRFELEGGAAWIVSAHSALGTAQTEITAQKQGAQHLVLSLAPVANAATDAVSPEEDLRAALRTWYEAPSKGAEPLPFTAAQEALLREHPAQVFQIAWDAYREAGIHEAARTDFEQRIVRVGEQSSAFTLKTVGTKPEGGWPLVIAMHGGGGAPKRVNDQQWEVMQRYYRDQPELGYLYLALRAPNDEWNGFYDDRICLLIERLIRSALLFAEVDPDRVSLIGYSHGGYGAFVIGTKMPDRFATIHSSAAAPTDGETRGENLRHTHFSFMVGSKDTAYGRRERCEAFDRSIRALRGDRTDIYPVRFEFIEGNGHTGLPDRDKIKELLQVRRTTQPKDLLWLPSDEVLHDFFWLHLPTPRDGQRVEVRRDEQFIEATLHQVDAFDVYFDSRQLHGAEEVGLQVDGHKFTIPVRPSLALLAECLQRRGDPRLAFDTVVRWRSRN